MHQRKSDARMSLLQLKKEVVPPSHHFHATSSSVRDGGPRIYPFGQTGLGARVRQAPGSDVTKFFPFLMRGPSAIQERIDLIPEREACLPLVGWQ